MKNIVKGLISWGVLALLIFGIIYAANHKGYHPTWVDAALIVYWSSIGFYFIFMKEDK